MKNSKLFKAIFYFFIGSSLLFANLLAFNTVVDMIRQPSDLLVGAAVYGSLIALCVDAFLIFHLYKKIKGLFAFALIVLIGQACTKIDAGHEGIRIQQYGTEKGVQDVTLVTGRVTYNPWTEDIEQIPLFVQTVDYDPFTVNAKGGSIFTVDPTISIRVIQGSGPSIYRKYRKDIDEVIKITVYNYVKDAYRIKFNASTPDHIISNRAELEDSVQNFLSRELNREGFHLEQLTSGIAYPQSITDAVNAKETAVQKAFEAENQLKLAEANAKIKIVEAEAESRSNALKQQSMTPAMIQAMFIDKWDGRTPLYGQGQVLLKDIK